MLLFLPSTDYIKNHKSKNYTTYIHCMNRFFRNIGVHPDKARKLSLRTSDWIRFLSLIYFKHVSVKFHVQATSVQGDRGHTLRCLPSPVCLRFQSFLTCLQPHTHFLIPSNSFSQFVLVLKHFEKLKFFEVWNQGGSEGQRGGSAFSCLSCSWNKRPPAMGPLPLKALI